MTSRAEIISLIQGIIDFFYSPWIKGLCCIFLIGEAIGLFFVGSQNKEMTKIFIPMMLGTVIFMCAGHIALGFGKIFGFEIVKKSAVPNTP